MKRITGFAFVSLILAVVLGCQQEQQKPTTGVSRKDRLVGYENIGLKDQLAKCQSEIENQKKLLADCQANCQGQSEKKCQEQVQLAEGKYKQNFDARCDEKYQQEKKQYEDNITWLLNDLPADLLKQVEELTKENEELKQKIEQFQNAATPAVAEPNTNE